MPFLSIERLVQRKPLRSQTNRRSNPWRVALREHQKVSSLLIYPGTCSKAETGLEDGMYGEAGDIRREWERQRDRRGQPVRDQQNESGPQVCDSAASQTW